jgi:Flp pilus assembly protein CpaB
MPRAGGERVDEAALRDTAGRLTAAVGGPRRVAAALLAAVAVVSGLRAVSPDAPPTRTVWAAARDLSGGRPLVAADLRRLALPAAAVPRGAVAAGERLVGRLVAAPMRRGEPFTDVRLLEPGLLAALDRPDLVAVPVSVADGAAAAALVQAGDTVDVLAVGDPATGRAGGPETVAAGVRVLSVPAESALGGDGGGVVVLAVSRTQAAALAEAAAGARLSLALGQP